MSASFRQIGWLLATAVVLSASPTRAADAPVDAAAGKGLVSFWSFDGSLKDAAGSVADDLSRRGGGGKARVRFVTAGELPGTSGKAVAIGVKTSDAEYLTAAVSRDVKLPSAYTIEAWIFPVRVAGWGRLVLQWGGPGRYAYHFAIRDGRVSLHHGQASGAYVFAEGGRMEPGRWHHVAGIARPNASAPSKSRLEVYLNGKLVAAAPFDGTIRTVADEGLGIGDAAGIPGSEMRYRGYIDELAVWGRALSSREIRAHCDKRADLLKKLEAAARERRIAARAGTFARLEKLGVEEIVFAERHPGRDNHYYANFGYTCIDPNQWVHGADGGRLCKLNLRTGELKVLVDDPGGAVRDPQVHYDAGKILFSYRKGGSHYYNLYEIGADGGGPRQVTSGAWDDVEPAYLPDGGIVFCSTRCKRFIGCWLTQTAILFRCDADGKNMRMLSSGAFTENTPAVLPDGRVLYTRWEYVNRDPVSFHHLWAMHPDGSGQMVYFGNMQPRGVFIDAVPIGGTDRIVFVHSPGHGRKEHAGRVVTVAARHGPNARGAIRNISRTDDFRDPYPLSENTFLAARGKSIVLLDGSGRTQVLHTSAAMLHEPRPIVARPREKVLPARCDPGKATATLLLADVYRGRNMAGVQRGAIKKLLVMEELPKPANYHGGGSQPIGHGVTSTLKRILGTVPVEADGSACFRVPPMRSVYFAALDANDLSVKQMRSFVTLQPGETAGCVGCHEPRTTTPAAGRGVVQALRRMPSSIQPVEDVPEVPDFPRDVQPILDRHCLRCHNHEKRKGGVVLAGDRGPVFSLSYYTLLLHWQIKDTGGNPAHRSGRQPGNDRPYAAYSSASPLMKKIDARHNEVKLTPLERKTIRLWIDAGATYAGTYAAYGTGQVGGCWGLNKPVRVMADGWPSTPPARDAVRRRCGSCHLAKLLPYHVTALTAADHGDMLSWTRPLSRFSRHRVFNLSRPDKSLVLLAPLSVKAGGYAAVPKAGKPRAVREDRSRPPKPIAHAVIFRNKADADYRKILAHIRAAKAKLDQIRRFDMPGFRPSEHYIRQMQRYGVLPRNLPADAAIDIYKIDEAYWRSLTGSR